MKALEKERARRYGTPSELAADIGRYLKHEPVVARPASTGYRLRKYVRRHRIAVGVAAGLVVLADGDFYGRAGDSSCAGSRSSGTAPSSERDRANA